MKVITAMALIFPVIALIALGPPAVLMVMVLMATFLGLREFYNLALPRAVGIERWTGIGLGLLVSILTSLGNARTASPTVVFLLLVLSLLFMATSRSLPASVPNLGITLFGVLYVSFLLAHVSLIRLMTNGRVWVLFLIATVWAADVFAYFTGSLLGRHKLFPKISPKKTYEGLAGAIGGSILVALAFSLLFLPQLEAGTCIALAVVLALLGQLGDFTESMIKRSAQVKDSGDLIPGHGGMLDRLDSFLFAAPALHYSLLFILKETP
jgi:phosphatidate cytidylyltransferase